MNVAYLVLNIAIYSISTNKQNDENILRIIDSKIDCFVVNSFKNRSFSCKFRLKWWVFFFTFQVRKKLLFYTVNILLIIRNFPLCFVRNEFGVNSSYTKRSFSLKIINISMLFNQDKSIYTNFLLFKMHCIITIVYMVCKWWVHNEIECYYSEMHSKKMSGKLWMKQDYKINILAYCMHGQYQLWIWTSILFFSC